MTGVRESMETGAVRQEELDGLLRLMCDAFDMDFDAARPIFYSDPYFESENKRVLRIDGRIVSCLTVVERECWLGQSVVKVAGIAGVATRPECQRRGFASRLLRETLLSCRQQGFALSALFPYAPDYYRKLGWEIAGEIPRARVSPYLLPSSSQTQFVRPADESDMQAIARIYDRQASGQAFHCFRDEKRWRYLFTYVRGKVVCAPDGRNVEGYLFYDYQSTPGWPGATEGSGVILPCLRVLEIAAESERAKRGLVGHLARQKTVDSIEFAAPRARLSEFGFPPGPEKANGPEARDETPEIAFMARILDWNALIQALLPNWNGFTGEILLVLEDSLLAGSAEAVLVTGDGKKAAARIVTGKTGAPSTPHVLEGDVRGWTPVAIGHRAPEAACHGGSLTPTTPEAVRLASALFPERAPFLPTADHF